MGYIFLPINTNSDDLTVSMLQDLVYKFPNWTPNESNLEVALIEILARELAETRDIASRVSVEIFKYFGKNLLGVATIDEEHATLLSTWSAIDTKGYTIPAGAIAGVVVSGNELVYFSVINETKIPAGSNSVSNVEMRALDAGVAANGLPAGEMILVDAFWFVNTVQSTTVSSGGVESETDIDYMDRLTTELQLLSPRPILPKDFEILAKRISGVERVLVLDGYNPTDQTWNNERMIAIAAVDEAGAALSGSKKTELQNYLDSLREINFVVNVIDPTTTTQNITVSVTKKPEFAAGVVQANIEAALSEYLSVKNWDWGTTLRYFDLIALVDNVEGVDYINSLTVPNADVVFIDPAVLVTAGTLSVTVV